jgi:hypothetical protein
VAVARGCDCEPCDRVEWSHPRRPGRCGRRRRLLGSRPQPGRLRGASLERMPSKGSARSGGDSGSPARIGRHRAGRRRVPRRRRHPAHVRLTEGPVRRRRGGNGGARGRSIRRRQCSGRWRCGRRRGQGLGQRIRERSGRHHRRSERWEEHLWVEVSLRIRGQPDAELHVRDRILRNAARPDDRDRLAFGDDVTPANEGCAEVQQRHCVAVRGLDRDRETVRRDPARERDRAPDRGLDRVAECALDVDAAVLARYERIVLREEEPAQDRAADRPCPCARGGRGSERGRRESRNEPEKRRVWLPGLQTAPKVAGEGCCCQIGLQRGAIETVTRHARQARDHFRSLPPCGACCHELRDGGGGGRLVTAG